MSEDRIADNTDQLLPYRPAEREECKISTNDSDPVAHQFAGLRTETPLATELIIGMVPFLILGVELGWLLSM